MHFITRSKNTVKATLNSQTTCIITMSSQSKPRMLVVTMNNNKHKHEAKQINSNNSNYQINILTRKGTRILPIENKPHSKVDEALESTISIGVFS